MLAIGDIVDVIVERVEVYGLFCRHEQQELLVLIPDLSWIASFCSSEQFAEPGDRWRVMIRFVHDLPIGKIAGTIKNLHPDPWTTDQLQPGKDHAARVVRFVAQSDRCAGHPAYLLELVPGAFVMLPAAGLSLRKDEICLVRVVESNFFRRSVVVVLQNEP